MILVSEAIDIVSRHAVPIGVESCSLAESVGRTLAEQIIADTDMPPFDRSQMDGYALRAVDTVTAPVQLHLVGESAAGRGWHHHLNAGEAVAIMTGAPIPDGADAVQKIELTDRDIALEITNRDRVNILEPVEVGRYIVAAASEVRKDQTLIEPGTQITEQMIATLAAFGYSEVKVGKRPRVAILGTGSEIVPVDQVPGRDQIRNSNSIMLAVMARRHGANVDIRRNATDDLNELRTEISDAASSADVLILTGGVSVGKYDLTKTAIAELGAEIFFEKVRLKPGKPAVFGRLGDTFIFGLPGNPVSAAVTFHLFVRPALALMQGRTHAGPKTAAAVLSANLKAARERDTYHPAKLSVDPEGRLIAEPLRWHGSSDFIGFSQADALIVAERGSLMRSGDVATIEFL